MLSTLGTTDLPRRPSAAYGSVTSASLEPDRADERAAPAPRVEAMAVATAPQHAIGPLGCGLGAAVGLDGRRRCSCRGRLDWNVHVFSFPPLHAEWDPRVGPGTDPGRGARRSLGIAYAGGLPSDSELAEPAWWRRTWSASAGWSAWPPSTAGTASGRSSTPSTSTSHTARDVTTSPRPCTSTSTGSPTAPDNWPVHIAGHPPGALLFFVLLVALGLGSGLAAGWVVLLVAATTPVAVLVTLRRLGAEDAARRAAPFLVLGPAAIWMAVSADAMFGAVAAWGLCCLAVAATSAGRAHGRLGGRRRTAARLLRHAVVRPCRCWACSPWPSSTAPELAARSSGPPAAALGGRAGLRDRRLLLVGGLSGAARAVLGRRREPPPDRLLGLGQPGRAVLQRRPRRSAPASPSWCVESCSRMATEPALGAARRAVLLSGAALATVAGRGPVRDEQGRGRAHLAAVRALAARRHARCCRRAGSSRRWPFRCASRSLVQHLLFTGW